jgi:hypothetical protein
VFIDDLAESIDSGDVNEIPECLLFADDILLACISYMRAQVLLNIVSSWCRANEMAINVSKCGTTYKERVLTINGVAIPQVDTYRYLGIPLSRTGIEPKGLIEENIRRAKGALALVKNSLSSRAWPPATRINVYKTYIRSVFEYAAPILMLLHRLDLNKREIKRGIKAMQRLQSDAVKWIFQKRRPLPTMESLAGLTTVEQRFDELTARFRLHLMSAASENPIRHWTTHGRGNGITEAGASYPMPRDGKVATIEARSRAASFKDAARKNRMAGYIDPAARLSSGMDACLCIQNSRLRNLAIRWRCNAFGIYHLCGICNVPFTRGHVGCAQLDIAGPIKVEYDQILQSGDHGENFKILDHLLNRKKFALFDRGMRSLQTNIHRAT